MSKIGVKLKIDVTQIEKARLYKGNDGIYLHATAFIDTEEADQWGNNGGIAQDISREEKDEGVKRPKIGNAQIFWRDTDKAKTAAAINSAELSPGLEETSPPIIAPPFNAEQIQLMVDANPVLQAFQDHVEKADTGAKVDDIQRSIQLMDFDLDELKVANYWLSRKAAL